MTPKASLAIFVLLFGCGGEQPAQPGDVEETSVPPATAPTPAELIGGEAGEAVKALLKRDPSLKKFFDDAHGFAVWPTVGKGGMIVGGGGGSGFVYEGNRQIGTSKLRFLSIGAQIGGQSFSEVIFFRDKVALDSFKRGNFEFGAQVSAIAVTKGVANDADYDKGVAVFTMPKGGLMAEASVSGQKFTFKPK